MPNGEKSVTGNVLTGTGVGFLGVAGLVVGKHKWDEHEAKVAAEAAPKVQAS